MSLKCLSIGFGNILISARIVAILSPHSSPMKRLKDEAKQDKRLIDASHGRKTRSLIVTDSNHVILSALQTETVANRFNIEEE